MAWASLQYGSLRRVELFTQSLGSLTAGSSEKRRSCLAFYDPDSEVISITSVTLYCWMQSDAHLDSRGGGRRNPSANKKSIKEFGVHENIATSLRLSFLIHKV